MATIDVWLTVVHGVADTTVKDFHRSERVFVHVPLRFKVKKFTLNKDQTKAILGTDGKLALTGGPNEFDQDLPAGAGSPVARLITVKDPNGRFSTEVWAAIKNWTDLGGLHIFYVPDFDTPGLEGGICLRMDDQIDPIIFVSQKANASLLSLTKGARGILEHEIGHAFGLKDTARANTLMNGIVSSDGSDAGTSLSQDELAVIANSRLLGLAAAAEEAHRQSRYRSAARGVTGWLCMTWDCTHAPDARNPGAVEGLPDGQPPPRRSRHGSAPMHRSGARLLSSAILTRG